MDSFFDAAQEGRFPNLADRDELWRLFISIAARKVVDLKRRETCRAVAVGSFKASRPWGGWNMQLKAFLLLNLRPSWVRSTEGCLFACLTPDLEALAVAKMEGCTNVEIAERAGCSVRTVERRLHLINMK